MTELVLNTFFRSSAAWRVRIALRLKGLSYDAVYRNFREQAQRAPDHLALNPQGLVPTLVAGGTPFGQSLAIIEYLDEIHTDPPLLPVDPVGRAQVRAMAQIVACDIHPIGNLRVLQYLRTEFGQGEDSVNAWYRHWVKEGFAALEALARASGDGRHCHGDGISIADICLVPQMYNARRFGTDLDPYPTLRAIDAHLVALSAFSETAPERQPDAV
jgi:maleylacetoacetate isomerase